MSKQYDLIAIGTGTAASGAAARCREAGWKVAVVDNLPFGGTCALRGCLPKKVLVGVAQATDHSRRMRGKGIGEGEPGIVWNQLIEFKRTFTEPVPAAKEEDFAKNGIAAYHGRARFRGPRSIEVDGEVLEGRFILVATGAVPMDLGIPGEEHLLTSTDFLDLDRLPKRVVFLGGGFIAAEFSHVAARAGAQVTVLERGERLLEPFDPDLGSLDLAAAGVASEKGRLKLNEFLQSVSNPAVYAVGDAAMTGPPLTPIASLDAKVAAANMLEGNHRKPNYLGVASVCFTEPPIASVGLSEQQARESGLRFRMRCEKTSDWYTARRVAQTTYGFKVLVEEGTDRVLGAHLVGPGVDEVINIFALAIRKGLTAEDLKATSFAYPTGASDISSML